MHHEFEWEVLWGMISCGGLTTNGKGTEKVIEDMLDANVGVVFIPHRTKHKQK